MKMAMRIDGESLMPARSHIFPGRFHCCDDDNNDDNNNNNKIAEADPKLR